MAPFKRTIARIYIQNRRCFHKRTTSANKNRFLKKTGGGNEGAN